MTSPPAAHTSFTIERSFRAPPAAVFAAWSDPERNRQWSDCHAEHTVEFSLDFRPLGRETHRVEHPEHGNQVVEKVFFDICADRRIVFAYDISVNGQRLSVSLVTVELTPTKTGTDMVYTEQIAYLDGHADLEQRIHGTGEGLDRLRLLVERHLGSAH
jgi:uncharacterized protein YndB with AHSA1/START domain